MPKQPTNQQLLEILRETHPNVFKNRLLKIVERQLNSEQWQKTKLLIRSCKIADGIPTGCFINVAHPSDYRWDYYFFLEMPDWFWIDDAEAEKHVDAALERLEKAAKDYFYRRP